MKNKYLLLIVILFLLLNIFLFRDVIFYPQRLLSFSPASDTFLYFGMSKFLESRSVHEGLMLWNPYLFCGSPWIGNPQNQIFYPLNSLFLFLPFQMAINYSFILHVFLMGIFMALFVRHLKFNWYTAMVSGLIFMFSGLVFLRCFAGHLFTLNAYLWLPLIFLLADICLRKGKLVYAVLAGLALAAQILAGNPQYSYYTVLAVFLYFLFTIISDRSVHNRKRRYAFGAAALFVFLAVGIGLAALRLLPVLEFSRLSNRSVPDYKMVAFFSFPPQNLITYFFPEFFGDMVHLPYWGKYYLWEMCGYVGILPVVLSLVAFLYNRNKYVLFFGSLSIFALLGSLGGHTPLLKLFYYVIPGFNKFRGHSKFLMLFVFSVPVLSAYGLSWLLERKKEAQDKLKKIVLSIGIVSGVLALVLLFAHFDYRLLLGSWMQIWQSRGLPSEMGDKALHCILGSIGKGAFFITAVFFLFFFWLKERIPAKVLKIAIVVLIVSDLWLFGAKFIVWEDVRKCFWDKELVSFMQKTSGPKPYRVFYYSKGEFTGNKGALEGISIIDGYDPLLLKRYGNFLRMCFAGSIDSPQKVNLLSMINLKYLIVSREVNLSNPAFSIVYKGDNAIIWQNKPCFPRAYIVHAAQFAEDDETALKMVFDDNFNPGSTVILKGAMPTPQSQRSKMHLLQERADILKYAPDEAVIRLRLQEDGYLVLSDAGYPGWKAEVLDINTGKSEEASILEANYAFRAVALKKGDYVVNFVFRPASFYAGALISFVTLAIVIAVLILMRGDIRT